jgi:nucleotide-binding universal stress UspA family protein
VIFRAGTFELLATEGGPFAQMLLGSVADQVVHLAHCPVIVARESVAMAA